MANIAFGSKYFIFSKFSTIPKTSKIEQDRASLAKEYSDYKEYRKSAELKEFEELNAYIESAEHKELLQRVRKNKAAEEEKIKTFADQKKSKKFKAFYKFAESQKLKDFKSAAASEDLEKYNELKALTTSADFSSRKHKLEQAVKQAGSKGKEGQDAQKTADLEKQLISHPCIVSSITTVSPASPRTFSSIMLAKISIAAAIELAAMAPFPAASPSAFIHKGGVCSFTYSTACRKSEKLLLFAQGIEYFCISPFAKALLDSICVAPFVGPNMGIPIV